MSLPRKGKIYNFFDDGKIRRSRLSKAYVKKIIPFNKANIYLKIAFATNAIDHDWIYTGDTPYFIGCYIPNYDKHLIWFAKTKWGGWFSMDIQSCWQGGSLDVEGDLTKWLLENEKEYAKYLQSNNRLSN